VNIIGKFVIRINGVRPKMPQLNLMYNSVREITRDLKKGNDKMWRFKYWYLMISFKILSGIAWLCELIMILLQFLLTMLDKQMERKWYRIELRKRKLI
jgi:hypothetical protein